LIVYIAGTILVLMRWRNHPRPSKMALAGLLVLIFNTVVMSFVREWILDQYYSGHWSSYAGALGILGIVRYAIIAAGIALLLFAVYTSRLPQAARRAERVRDMDFPFAEPKLPLREAIPVQDRETAIRDRKE
jgi:hypothetical protein